MLTDTEVATRLPVWCALSELFVDTVFDRRAADTMAAALRASGLPPATIDRILRDEVAPVFHANVAAGNWTGWRSDDVRTLVTAHLARPRRLPAPLRRWIGRLQMAAFEADWQAVRDRLAPPPDRE